MKNILLFLGFLLFIFVNNTFAIPISLEEFNSRASTYYSEEGDDDIVSSLSGLDINSFVVAVLRESYQTQSKILQDYADKVQSWNDLKISVRERLKEFRESRNEFDSEILPYLFYMDSDSEETTILVSGVDADSLNTVNQYLSISRFSNYSFAPSNPVPEPSTMLLLGTGLLGLAGWRRRKFRKN